jgi:multidrug resistance efflux pump
MNADKITILKGFSDDELKEELNRRRVLDRAKRHLPSAEAALQRAQEKVKQYREALERDKKYAEQRIMNNKKQR